MTRARLSTLRATGALLSTGALLAGCHGTYNPYNGTYFGNTTSIGSGTGRTYVTLAQGVPTEVGIELSPGTLDNLPAGGGDFSLDIPIEGQQKGLPIDHIMVDWNPNGHEPPGIYDRPHFDFHFYLIDEATQASITPGNTAAAAAPSASMIPATYVAPPGNLVNSLVPEMGVHFSSPSTSPEFQGQAFTSTFIYGFAFGKLAFLEPMVTRAFLLAQPANFSAAIPQPNVYPQGGYYPTRYRVTTDGGGTQRIILDQFVQRGTAGGG